MRRREREALRRAGADGAALAQNAGISIVKPALELTDDDFKKVFDVNVLGGAYRLHRDEEERAHSLGVSQSSTLLSRLLRAFLPPSLESSTRANALAHSLWTARKQTGSIVIVSSMSSQIVNSPLTQVRLSSPEPG